MTSRAWLLRLMFLAHQPAERAGELGHRLSMSQEVGDDHPRDDAAAAERDIVDVTAVHLTLVRSTVDPDIEARRRDRALDRLVISPDLHALHRASPGARKVHCHREN